MEFINTLSNNSVIGAFVAGVAVLMCVSLFKWINRRFCKAPKVFKTLEAGLEKHNFSVFFTVFYTCFLVVQSGISLLNVLYSLVEIDSNEGSFNIV